MRCLRTHIEGDDADLDGVAILHPDHPLALVVVKGVQSSLISVDVPSAPVVRCSVTVVPGEEFFVKLHFSIPLCNNNLHALQFLDIPCRELCVSCLSDARVLWSHRVLAVVDGERLEAVVHNRCEVVALPAGVHLI